MTKKDISKYYADEQVIRFIAAQVIIIVSMSLWQGWLFPFFFLSTDFALRAFTYQPAPLAASAKMVTVLFRLDPEPIFAAPKKFAAGIGFICSLTILVFLSLHYYAVAYIVGGVLVFFAFLEAVFKICVGCYVYHRLVAPVVNRRNTKMKADDSH